MKEILKRLAAWLARSRPVRSAVTHLVYPNIVAGLKGEIQPDEASPSGIAEDVAWKVHSYIVLNEELRSTGVHCAEDRMRSDDETRARLFEATVKHLAGVEGDILEFGVASGDSLRDLLRLCPGRQIYGFDSFEGLPEEWWTRPKGAFKAKPPEFSDPNVSLIKGLFDETIPDFLSRWQGPAALVHVDCDLYQSTLASLGRVLQACHPGAVVVFDEYYNYPGFAVHEWLAWKQLRLRHRIEADCIAFDGRRASFRIRKIGDASVA